MGEELSPEVVDVIKEFAKEIKDTQKRLEKEREFDESVLTKRITPITLE